MEVTILTRELHEKLKVNRDSHAKEYAETRKAYEAAVIDELTEKLARVQKGEDIGQYVKARAPKSHVNYYDKAIAMCGMHTGETMRLNTDQFARYVQDEWEWKDEFRSVSSTYGK